MKTATEQAEEVLKTFDHKAVARHLKKTQSEWWFPKSAKHVPSADEVRTQAKQMLLELLTDQNSTIAITSGDLIVVRQGSRLGVAYCPVRSEEFLP
jgi:hypothetical protein